MSEPAADVARTQDPAPARRHGPGWHALGAAEVLEALGTGAEGLSGEEARRRLEMHGPNRLPEEHRPSGLARFLLQFRNPLIYVLLAAAVIAAAIGHRTDALVILAVVLVNALVGFVQEGRAERALDAIRAMIEPRAAVLRGGHRVTVEAEEVVPGDIVLIEAGDRVPADVRLLAAPGLMIDEAVLSGESVPVEKGTAAVAEGAALPDRSSMAHSGTMVTAGRARGVAVATGVASELGRISTLVGSVERLTTPLVAQMDGFARQVTLAILAGAVLLFAYAALILSAPLEEVFMAVVGMAVAAIPEGLPAVLTITLAIGVQRMARRNAIIRRLPAVETLGAVSVICSDKTGTLTRNEMVVRSVRTADREVEVEGTGYGPEGVFRAGGQPVEPAADPVLAELMHAAASCNDAVLRREGEEWVVHGDPMEGALLALAARGGHGQALQARPDRLDEIPFDPRQRYMATLHARADGPPLAYVKGAPEAVIERCAHAAAPGGTCPVDADFWHRETAALAAAGQRVLALARRTLPDEGRALKPGDLDDGLVLLGLVGLIDPPRPEAVAAIAECRAAGIGLKMITGDHATTAGAIAVQLGLADRPDAVTGRDLDGLDEAAFRRTAREAAVFARTSPEHKLRLVEALQEDGGVVAMTGDGVNDAPALRRADVGVAMGRKGTEAARQASEMVLGDDNFASIVAAVREGRTVYDNLTKVIAWTLPTSGGEALTIVFALVVGLALPISPVQILWVNMVTAVTLGLTLAFEPTEPEVMRRPPRPRTQPLLTGRLLWRILFVSLLMVAGAFGVFAWSLAAGMEVEAARTMVVNTLVVMEIFYLFSVRYVHRPSLTWQGVLGTRAVLVGIAIVTAAQLALTFVPAMQTVFGTRALPPANAVAIVAIGVALLLVVEIEKWVAARLGLG